MTVVDQGKKRRARRFIAAALVSVFPALAAAPAGAAGILSVEVVNGYNLVVDSNVTAPSTYAPAAAYIGARICNTGDAALSDVIAYAGDHQGGVGDRPGVFPAKSFGPDPVRPHLAGTGSYSLTLESGGTGAADGTRYIGALAAGACRMEYWLISYPQCVNVGGLPQSPPCAASIAGSIQPTDDLSLDYDVWATSAAGPPATVVTRSFTMRNEISAAANKIWPNTTAKVPDVYLAAIQSVVGWGTLGPDGQPLTAGNPVYPGQRVITTQGIWYDLGNVGHGFDNNGDLIPDQNAWLQPVGDPSVFDADCFRLVNVYGIVIVKLKTGGELLIPFANELYFQNIPDNTGVVGLVYYQFVATDTGCSGNLTPYQEAASGFDNEKFSADYGLSLGLRSGSFDPATELTFTKSDGVTSVAAGGGLTYTVTASNFGTGVNLGAPDLGTPLTFRERLPAGATFVAGSADDAPAANLAEPAGTGSYAQGYTGADGNLDTCTINYRVGSSSFTVLYSADGGATWSLAEPPAATVTDIQWLLITTLELDGGHDGTDCVAPNGVYDNGALETSLPPGKSAVVRFQVTVKPAPAPVLCNAASLQFGPGSSGITARDCDLVTGNNTLSGTVFRDNGVGAGGVFGNGVQDGTEAGIGAGLVVELYYDTNGDGRYDGGDLRYGSAATAANGAYSFAAIPDGPYVVVVQKYGAAGAGNDVNDFVPGWGDTTYDPNLPLTSDQGILKLNEDLNRATLAVNVDFLRDSGAQTVANVNFGFAPPLRLTKAVQENPDANLDGRADAAVDEGDLLTYAISLENRLPSVGRQGPSGCEYTVWASAGATGNSPKNFTNPGDAYDAASPNGTVASAVVDGGGLRWIYGRSFALAPQLGNISKVEALYFGYFSKPLSDDFLTLQGSFGANSNGLTTPLKTGTLSTAMIDSYVGPRADYDPNRAISWDISALRPGCAACSVADWGWGDFPGLHLLVNADKASAADAKSFSLDAIGVRVTSDKDCEAGASTTLGPVPLQDSYDTGSFTFVSADPAPTAVNTATGLIQWDDVGPILPGTMRTVTVTLRARDVNGLRTGSCGASSPPAANSACNWAETAYGGRHVSYADGRAANDDSGKIAVAIQGKAELHGTVWNDADDSGWNIGAGETGLPGVAVSLHACVLSDGVTLETGTPNSSCVDTKNGGKNDLWVKLATTFTDATGAYQFLGLDTGYYIVEVGDTDGQPASGAGGNSAPFGMAQTAEPNDNQGATAGNANAPAGGQAWNNTWGDINLNLSALNILTQATEEEINGINFGYYSATAVIHGVIWHDIDGDAVTDAGEAGLSGFTVRLYTDADGDGLVEAGDTLVATTTSGAAGGYAFSGLAVGSYVVVVEPPTLRSTVWGETVETSGGTASLDNRIPVSVAAGAFSGSHDFGYTRRGGSSIGDTLYYDFDADGRQGAAEAGIPNVTVRLYQDVDRDGIVDAGVDGLLRTASTDDAGEYLFDGLPAGSYVVQVDTADPDFPTQVTATGDPDTNGAGIGDQVWYDLNGDGVLDAGEDGIAGVVVNLYVDADGDGVRGGGEPLVASTSTDANGAYRFTGLNGGGYFVDVDEATLPSAALALTTGDPATILVTLAGRTSASLVLSADAGYRPAAGYAIGNRVWSDADGDNVQDAGEVGIPGVRLVVTNGTGTGCSPACTATTDANGFWIVTGLTDGTFTVDVTNADLPRDSTLTGGVDPRVVTVAGASLANVDFGYRYNTDGNPLTADAGDPTGSITGRVFNDVGGEGVYDAGEEMAGTTVNLLDRAGAIIGTTTTAPDGTYAFGGVFIGDYAVQTVDQLGTRYSVIFLSAGEAFPNLNVVYRASSATVADSQSAVSVDGVHADLNQDFGYQRFQGSIGDTVYQDVNENATQDLGEPGIAGVTVSLLLWKDAAIDGGNGDGVVDAGELTLLQTATTTADDPLTPADEGGKYLFSNLVPPPPGQYFLVRVETATLPGTASLIADPDTDGDVCPLLPPLNPVCDSQQVVGGYSAGINYLGADFGYRIAGSGHAIVGDHLWIDADGDGAIDSGELGVRFVTVWFDTDDDGALDWVDGNANGVWDSAEGERWVETDSDGYYVFTDVADGAYTVRVLATDADWPAGLPTTPVYEARSGNAASRNNQVQVVVAGGVVTSIVDGDGATPDACVNCDLDADFGYRYAGSNSLRGTICTESGALNGYCGATATTLSGVGLGESPLAGIQVTLYRWTDDGDNAAWTGAALDAGDTFTPLGSASTDANGDYFLANVPDNVVVVVSLSDTQNLRLTTTNANTSVEDGLVVSRQLFEGTTTYQGRTVTVLARQALNLGPDADDAIVDLDFAFDGSLGGTVTYDFGDLPDSAPLDFNATLLANGGARHQISGIMLGASVSAEVDGRESAAADLDTGDDGVVLLSTNWVPGAEGAGVEVTASAAGWLAAWVDFNGDGDFSDAGELVIDRAVVAGAQVIAFDVPASIDGSGLIFFTRFRIYPGRPLLVSSTGLAFDAFFQPAGGEVEDYRWNVNVTPAVVSSFTARDAGGVVALEWRTSSGVGTVGFFLKRRDEGSGSFVDVNQRLLPALIGTPQGGTYRYLDPGASAGRPHDYQLVEIESSGRSTVHGPFRVDPRAGGEAVEDPAANESGYSRTPAAARATPAAAAAEDVVAGAPEGPAAAAAASTAPLVRRRSAKIATAEEGVHFLRSEDLARELGLPTAQVRRLLADGRFRMGNRGAGVSFLPARDRSGVFFYAAGQTSSFTRDNVYWVRSAPTSARGMRSRREDAAGRATGRETFVRTERVEQDLFPAHAIFGDARQDHWLWEYFVAGEPGKRFALRSDGVAPGAATAELSLLLLGASDTPAEPDHHAVIRLNGTVVGDLQWNGLATQQATLAIDPGLLVDGENSLEIVAMDDTAAPYSVFYLDSFALRYESRYRAADDRLTCDTGANAAIRLSGFSTPNILVFDVTAPRHPIFVRARAFATGPAEYGVDLAPRARGRVYHAVALESVTRVDRVRGDRPSSLKNPANRGAYVVVAGAGLQAEAARLAAYRGGRVVDLEDVYDEFNHGVPSPYALRSFLKYAWRHWKVKPRYVVLAGDGSYDYRDNLGLGGNLIPPMLIPTGHGLFASDTWFADVAGGAAPEMAIGRLPAADAGELRLLVDKIVLRESAPEGDWTARLVALADNADDAGDFAAESDRIAGRAPAAERIYLGPRSIASARAALFAALRAGVGTVNYFGHSGYDTLAEEGLLTAGDVDRLDNAARPTVLTAMTCLAGDFSVPGYPGIGELLVRAANGGAAAVWAPTGLSVNSLASLLAEEFYKIGFADEDARIGDAILGAMRVYEQTRNPVAMLGIYVLIGDPAMPLR